MHDAREPSNDPRIETVLAGRTATLLETVASKAKFAVFINFEDTLVDYGIDGVDSSFDPGYGWAPQNLAVSDNLRKLAKATFKYSFNTQ